MPEAAGTISATSFNLDILKMGLLLTNMRSQSGALPAGMSATLYLLWVSRKKVAEVLQCCHLTELLMQVSRNLDVQLEWGKPDVRTSPMEVQPLFLSLDK